MKLDSLPVLLSVLIAAVVPLNAAPFAGGRWVDLTHDFSAETLYWPTASSFVLEKEFHGQTEKGYFYAANRYSASEHGGTHLDAPEHFAEVIRSDFARYGRIAREIGLKAQ